MPDYSNAIIIMVVMGIATFATRIVPVLIFGRGEKVPDLIMYLGEVVPFTAMGLLIVYCLKDVKLFEGLHGLPEIFALALVSVSYLWKRNAIFSVVIGTIFYMILVQRLL